jgi:hypothetical protein
VIFLWGPGELDYVKDALALSSGGHILAPAFDLLDLAFDYAEMAPRILQGALADLLKQRGILADTAAEAR